MKTVILLSIIAVSISAFSQNNRMTSQIRHTSASVIVSNMKQSANGSLKSGRPNFILKEKFPVSLSHFEQKSATQLFDSAYMWRWDTTYADWALDYKYSVVEYDANNNALSELGENWDGSAWGNADSSSYTFNDSNIMLGSEWWIWSGTDWENAQKESFEYDANNNMLSEIVAFWDGNTWMNGFQIKRTYDVNSNMTSYLHQNWNGEDWDNYWQYVYTYDVNNNMTSELRQLWAGDHWEDSWQNTFEYDINNNLIHEINYVDNGAELVTSETKYFYNAGNQLVTDSVHTWGNSWQYDLLGTYTYDSNGNLIIWLSQSVNGDILENLTRSLSTYDAAHNKTTSILQDWKGNSWVNSGFDRHSYNEYNNLTNDAYKYWNSEGSMVMDGDSTAYYYHDVLNEIRENTRMNSNASVFPNPNNGEFTVACTGIIQSIGIYDVRGKLIYLNSGSVKQMQKQIHLSDYDKGIFLLKIQTDTGIVTKKLVVQ